MLGTCHADSDAYKYAERDNNAYRNCVAHAVTYVHGDRDIYAEPVRNSDSNRYPYAHNNAERDSDIDSDFEPYTAAAEHDRDADNYAICHTRYVLFVPCIKFPKPV